MSQQRSKLIAWRKRLHRYCGLGLTLALISCSAPGGPSAPAAVMAPAPAPSAAAPLPAPARLGTQWGEGVASSVVDVRLSRLTPSHPEALMRVFYNDVASTREASRGRPYTASPFTLTGSQVALTVLNENNVSLGLYATTADNVGFLEGENGQRYRLKLENNGTHSVEIVATVDGLDVLNGRPGSLSNPGYVVYPGNAVIIEGFRKSQDEVAAFRFSSRPNAYAANSPNGDINNLGVIGLAVFALNDPSHTLRPPSAFPGDTPYDPRYAPPPRYR